MDLTNRLREFAKERDRFDVATYQFVGLEDIQRAYGERWVGEHEKVAKIAEDFLLKRLGEQDMLIKGRDGFLVVFADKIGEEAEVQADLLNQGMNSFFLGESSPRPMLTMQVKHQAMGLDALIESLGDVNFVSPTVLKDIIPSKTIDWKFQPMWDVRREALAQSFVVPILKGVGSMVPGYRYEPAVGQTPNYPDIDEASLLVSEKAMREMFRLGKRSLMGTLVHVNSLSGVNNRARFLAMTDVFDRELMRYRILRVCGLQPGFPRMYLQEVIGMLKRKLPNIVINVAWNEPDLKAVLSTDPTAVGMALPPELVGPNPTVSNAEVFGRIRAAAAQVHAAGKPFYVDGGMHKSMVSLMMKLGVDSVSSHHVWAPADVPESISKWPAAQLAA